LKRLSIGRLLRYLDLWARYVWHRTQRAVFGRGVPEKTKTDALAATIANLEPIAAQRLAVESWFPLDLTNATLHIAMLESVAEARPDLGITSEILDCLRYLKTAKDLSAAVDALIARGEKFQTINTALYILLLRRTPDPSEMPMITSRHPQHALIAILSGNQYLTEGRRTV
jgi:hypothetical protein